MDFAWGPTLLVCAQVCKVSASHGEVAQGTRPPKLPANACWSSYGPAQTQAAQAAACRYKRLYNAAIKDRAFTYAWFFLFYLVHIGWCIWAAVSPPIPFGFSKWALAGYVAGIKAFGPSIFVGVVFVVGASFWALEALWSFWVLQKVPFLLGVVVTFFPDLSMDSD